MDALVRRLEDPRFLVESGRYVDDLAVAGCLDAWSMPAYRLRVIAPDVGGGFGTKCPLYPGRP